MKKARVLVVDDDPGIRSLLVTVLERAGYQAVSAGSLAEAEALLGVETIDAVLLDQQLPDGTGNELVRRLRSGPATATMPVILVTGQHGNAHRLAGLETGATDYVTKPVNAEELVARLANHLRLGTMWADRIRAGYEDRKAMLRGLALMDLDGEPTALAGEAAAALLRLDRVGRVTIYAVDRRGPGPLVATAGAIVGFPPVPAAIPRWLHSTIAERTDDQVWVDDVPAEPADGPGPGPNLRRVYMGLRRLNEPVAVVFLDLEPGADDATESQVRGAALDAALLLERAVLPRVFVAGQPMTRRGLRAIIGARSFTPVFQPIIDLRSAEVVGYEALTRFDDGTPPEMRFAEARDAGVGLELELAVLAGILERAGALPPAPYLSVNLSAAALHSAQLAPLLRMSEGRAVVLELTEHEPISDYDAVQQDLDALGAALAGRGRLRLAIDDAGSGYASLRHVLSLRPGVIKLDHILVSGLHRDPALQVLVMGLVRFASEIGAEIVGEGVEEPEEAEQLLRIGVRFGQGYLFGRPQPLEPALSL